MMDREKLLKDLVRDEGLELAAYPDSEGFLTIGIGRLIDKRRGGGISEEEAYYLAGHDIDAVEADLDRALPWWRSLSEPRQRALANMCFNLGISKLLEFRKALRALAIAQGCGTGPVAQHYYAEAAREMLDSKWADQVGERAERLAQMVREG